MSTSTHPNTLRNCARTAIPVLLVCALVLLSGCLPLPEGKTPGLGTAKVEVTRSAPESGATVGKTAATSRPAALSTAPGTTGSPATEPSAAMAPSRGTPQPLTPGTSGATAVPAVRSSASCEPSDGPEVYAMGAPQTGAMELTPICITGFLPDVEVELWVTDPDAEFEYFNVLTDGVGTATVDWSAGAGFLTGTYTFEATQDDLRAIGSIDVEPGPELEEPASELQELTPEPQEPAHEPRESGPWIEVYPAGDSGGGFEVALGGFEPYQEVQLTLYVATDETGLDYQEIDTLYEQVDAQGEATFPLELTPAEYPSSWFALAYFLEDGTSVYAPFQVE